MKKETTYQIVAGVVMAVLMCVLGLVNIPVGGTVVALVSLVVYVGAFLAGPLAATLAAAAYVLLGIIGLPIFANGAAGFGFIKGSMGFFPIGLLFMAFISAVYVRNTRATVWKTAIAMVVATVVYYLVGMIWFVWVEKSYMGVAFSGLVKNQILWDVIKLAIGIAIGKPLRTMLVKKELIVELPEEKKEA